MQYGSINVYAKNPIAVKKIQGERALSTAKIQMENAFIQRALELKQHDWRKFEGQYKDIQYTLIHGADGVGAACYQNRTVRKVKINFTIENVGHPIVWIAQYF